MFILVVRVEVKPDLLDAFRDAIVKNAMLSIERDPGCVRFDVLQQQDDPTRWMFYEVYHQEQDWLDHRNAAHFLAFMEVGNRAIVTREVTKFAGVNVTS